MTCSICDAKDWHSLGNITENQTEKLNLQVCKNCGYVCYEATKEDEKKLTDFYRTKYRPEPNISNLITTTNKQNYIFAFLGLWLEEREKRGDRLICGDVGCATGYIPGALRKRGHRATGSELTLTFRRFAEHFYGVPVTEELETKHKYDLITIYHVLEHLVAPDEKLAHYVSLLADDGRILVSTPEWFGPLEVQSGEAMKGRWHYWHKNHINCFSRQALQNVFTKCGLEVVKTNFVTYGQTYLLKKASKKQLITKESGVKRIEDIQKINKALDYYKDRKFDQAISLWPNFPEAYIGQIFGVYGKDRDKQKHVFDQAFKIAGMKDSGRMLRAYGEWLYQGERFDEAIEVFRKIHSFQPRVDILIPLGHCFAAVGDHKNAASCFYKAAEINPLVWQECMDKMCHQFCQIPAWDEVAREKIKEHLLAQAGPVIKPKDPVMDESRATQKQPKAV